MVSPQIIQVLHLVDSNDPVLRCERLFHSTEFRTLLWQACSSDTVHGLTGWEERVVVVVRHFVHERISHSRRGFVIDAVFTAGGEEIAFLHFIGPDA